MCGKSHVRVVRVVRVEHAQAGRNSLLKADASIRPPKASVAYRQQGPSGAFGFCFVTWLCGCAPPPPPPHKKKKKKKKKRKEEEEEGEFFLWPSPDGHRPPHDRRSSTIRTTTSATSARLRRAAVTSLSRGEGASHRAATTTWRRLMPSSLKHQRGPSSLK